MGQVLGVSFQQIQKHENGVNRLSPTKMKRYAESVGVTINYLMGEAEADPTMLPPLEASQQKQVWLWQALQQIECRKPATFDALRHLLLEWRRRRIGNARVQNDD
jgi:hypothetical protein